MTNVNTQGFHSVESLNGENTRIALVWNNTKEVEGYHYNETASKEIIDCVKLPKIVGEWLTRLDMDEIARRLMKDNGVSECAVNYETV